MKPLIGFKGKTIHKGGIVTCHAWLPGGSPQKVDEHGWNKNKSAVVLKVRHSLIVSAQYLHHNWLTRRVRRKWWFDKMVYQMKNIFENQQKGGFSWFDIFVYGVSIHRITIFVGETPFVFATGPLSPWKISQDDMTQFAQNAFAVPEPARGLCHCAKPPDGSFLKWG